MKNQTIVLEPSTNTHTLTANKVEVKELGNSILKLKIQGDGVITHGEHGVLKTESSTVIKYVQQEYNPVTKAMQNAFD